MQNGSTRSYIMTVLTMLIAALLGGYATAVERRLARLEDDNTRLVAADEKLREEIRNCEPRSRR